MERGGRSCTTSEANAIFAIAADDDLLRHESGQGTGESDTCRDGANETGSGEGQRLVAMRLHALVDHLQQRALRHSLARWSGLGGGSS